MAETLRFDRRGEFRLLQVTDIQEPPNVAPDTMCLLDAAVEAARPDLVVFTGDQIKGYDARFRYRRSIVERAVAQMTWPVWSRGIPFAVTYGNHDRECGYDGWALDEMYRQLPGCLNGGGQGPGTFLVPVAPFRGEGTALAVWLLDSGGALKRGGYASVSPDKLRWMEQTHTALTEERGAIFPSIVFQHIPAPEYMALLRRAEWGEPGTVRQYRGPNRGMWALDRDRCYPGGRLREPVGCGEEDTGELDILEKLGGVMAVYCGHNHKNSFVGRYRGIDLGYTPCCGFTTYGPGVDRGVRLFTFREDRPGEYETELLTYRQLVGPMASRPVRDWLYTSIPTSEEEARHLAKRVLYTAASAAAFTAVCRRIYRRRR